MRYRNYTTKPGNNVCILDVDASGDYANQIFITGCRILLRTSAPEASTENSQAELVRAGRGCHVEVAGCAINMDSSGDVTKNSSRLVRAFYPYARVNITGCTIHATNDYEPAEVLDGDVYVANTIDGKLVVGDGVTLPGYIYAHSPDGTLKKISPANDNTILIENA